MNGFNEHRFTKRIRANIRHEGVLHLYLSIYRRPCVKMSFFDQTVMSIIGIKEKLYSTEVIILRYFIALLVTSRCRLIEFITILQVFYSKRIEYQSFFCSCFHYNCIILSMCNCINYDKPGVLLS